MKAGLTKARVPDLPAFWPRVWEVLHRLFCRNSDVLLLLSNSVSGSFSLLIPKIKALGVGRDLRGHESLPPSSTAGRLAKFPVAFWLLPERFLAMAVELFMKPSVLVWDIY